MKVSEYKRLMKTSLQHRRRVLAVGKPGVGKTQGASETCQESEWDFIGMCSALEDPSTIRGYPSRGNNGEATHCLFDGIARAFKATRPTLLFFDDLGMASESTMRSIVRLVQFGEIDNRKLPDCVLIGAATNDIGHGAGVYGMIEPLKSRFHTIVEVDTNLDDVIAYGLARDWPSDMLAYLRNDPEALHDWKPCKSMHIDGACPRGWEYAAEWVNCGVLEPEVLGGCVGKGRATAYLAYRALADELPDINQVLNDPKNAPLPSNPSARYLVSCALASNMTWQNFGRCLIYLKRIPSRMFLAFAVRDAFRAQDEKRRMGKLPKGYRSIAESKDFVAWNCTKEAQEIAGFAAA